MDCIDVQSKNYVWIQSVASYKNRGSFVTFVLMNPNPIGAHFRILNNKHIPTDTVKTRDGGEKALEISA